MNNKDNFGIGTFGQRFQESIENSPNSFLVVDSKYRPCDSNLAAVIAEGRKFGNYLASIGIKQGDVIACMLPAWKEWLVAFIGAIYTGAIFLPIVTIYRAKELGFIMRQSGAKILITPDNFRNVDFTQMVADAGELPQLQSHLMVGEGRNDLENLSCDKTYPEFSANCDDIALLVYTSGTTADPKGVLHSHKTLLSEIDIQQHTRQSGQNEVIFSPFPPGHVAGALALMRFLATGTPIVTMDIWDSESAAFIIDKYKITSSAGTPFHLNGIIESANKNSNDLSSLTNFVVGAAPVPDELIARCLELNMAVYHCYGSSEHPTVTSGTKEDPIDKQLHTEGKTLPLSQIRFIDDEDNFVADGEVGEIVTKGPELFLGYFDQALNDKAFTIDGWYKTGDIGRIDAEGYLIITDRKKDIIIRGGENISSKEVEDILLKHPDIIDVAVVAAPDKRMGEVVLACIVAKPNISFEVADIHDFFVQSGAAKQKIPELVAMFDILPRNASGKILKHELRDWAKSKYKI